jgi:hypothetical protein
LSRGGYASGVVASALEAEATRSLDELLARMGSDVCIWSVALAIDEIVAGQDTDPATRNALRGLLRRQVGLDDG